MANAPVSRVASAVSGRNPPKVNRENFEQQFFVGFDLMVVIGLEKRGFSG
jgi:hypothetical protein